ncbi:Leucine-rich repeat 3 [Sesbania bispinosa]|nr:Leucine-rich repeat 3 [Sesbania bispinosa]
MSRLQFLDFHSGIGEDSLDLLPQGLNSLSTNLRYLHWMHYPLKSLPEKFSAKNLVILDLSYSQVEKLWHGVQNLVNLKEVILNHAKFLKELPDFSKATNLEVLDVNCCHQLNSVHPSIFSLNKLEKLDLSLCFSLTKFTSDAHLSSLRYLNLGYCQNLRKFSVKSENITELHLTGIRANALPSSFGCQTKLEVLVLGASEIKSLPSCIKNLTRLRHLDLRFCSKLQALPELPSSLETLLIDRGRSLKTVLFPSTAAEQLKENRKRVEFWNCLNLDESSLMDIGLNAQINLMKFTYQHLSSPEHDHVENYDDYKDKIELNISIINGEGEGDKSVNIYIARSIIKVTARTETNVFREKPEVELKGFGVSPHHPMHFLLAVEDEEFDLD